MTNPGRGGRKYKQQVNVKENASTIADTDAVLVEGTGLGHSTSFYFVFFNTVHRTDLLKPSNGESKISQAYLAFCY